MRTTPAMKAAECLRILGLPATASRRDIKRAYRRLALEYHPDKRQGDEKARRHFVELSRAYQTLMRSTHRGTTNRETGICACCGQLAEVYRSPDGRVLCERCVLRPGGRRFLPLPPIVVVKCIVSAVLNLVAAGCLVAALLRHSSILAAAACMAGLLALASLAVTCLSIRYCAQPGERTMYRRLGIRQTSFVNNRR